MVRVNVRKVSLKWKESVLGKEKVVKVKVR